MFAANRACSREEALTRLPLLVLRKRPLVCEVGRNLCDVSLMRQLAISALQSSLTKIYDGELTMQHEVRVAVAKRELIRWFARVTSPLMYNDRRSVGKFSINTMSTSFMLATSSAGMHVSRVAVDVISKVYKADECT